MDDTQELSPRSDNTDDVSEDDGTSSTSSDRTNDFSEDDGRLSDDFFSDDECSADPPFVTTPPVEPSEAFLSGDECPADPPPASPPPVENPLGHLLPECKCAAKLADFFDKMETAYGMIFDEHGVAVLPKVTSCRDRGTVTIRTHCSCPKVTCPEETCPEVTCPEVTCPKETCPEVTDYSFSPADYQSLFV